MGPQEDYIETVVTCEGDYHDPELHRRLEDFRQSLQDLLYTEKDKLVLKKVEPWNSVRVTFNISREAALRLKLLAQQGNATLRQLGVLAVQIQGDQAVSLTLAGRNNERTELIIRTDSTPGPPSVSFSDPTLPSTEELNSPSPSNVEATRKNIADYLRQGQALQQGSNLVETLFGPGALGQNSDVFRPPGMVAATSQQNALPFRSSGAVSSPSASPSSAAAVSPSQPYLNPFPQGRSPPGFNQGPAFPMPPNSSPGPSTGGMKFSPPSFPSVMSQQQQQGQQQGALGPFPQMDLMGLPPPPPYPHSTAVMNNISRPTRTAPTASPLLVNLLQTDPLGMGMNSLTPMKMLPPSGEGGPPPKKKRRPRKKSTATATVTSASLLEEEQQHLPGLSGSPVPQPPSPVPVPPDATPSVPVPMPASSSLHDAAENPSMDDEHPFLNPADPNAVFPPTGHHMSPQLPVIPLSSSAAGLELGLGAEQLDSMDTCQNLETSSVVVSPVLVASVQEAATAPVVSMEVDASEVNQADGKLVNPVTGDLETVDTSSDLSPVKEREQVSAGLDVPASREEVVLAQTCTTTTSQKVPLSQTAQQAAPAPAPTVTVQAAVVDSVRIPGLPGSSHSQPSASSNSSQVPVTCVAQPPVSSVQNSLSLNEPAIYASSSQPGEVPVHPATGVTSSAHPASSLPAATSASSPVVHTAVSNPSTSSSQTSSSVIASGSLATQSSSVHIPSPSPPDTSAGGQPAVERRRESSVEAKVVVVSESVSQGGRSRTASQASPPSGHAKAVDPYLSLSSPSTRNHSASPNASPDNKMPSEGDENSNHSGIINDISADMGTSQGVLLDSSGNKVYNHDSGIGSSSERSDDTPSEPGDNEYRSSHMAAEGEECSKSQKLVNCKQEAKVITVGYVMNNDHHSALAKDKNDLSAVQELKDRVPSLVRRDEGHHGPNQVTVSVVHLASKDQKNLEEPVKSVAHKSSPPHACNSQREPMKNGPQGEKKRVSSPSEDVRCRKQVKSPPQPDSRTPNHSHPEEENSLKDSASQQSNMALAPAMSRHILSNGPVTKSPEEATEADKHHADMEICMDQAPPPSTLRNDSTQAPESLDLALDQPSHLISEADVSEMKEAARLAFNVSHIPEGQAVGVDGAMGLLEGRYQARSPREMVDVEGGCTSPTSMGRGRGSPPEALRGSNITSMYSKQSVAVNVNLLNHLYSAGLPPPRRLTESVQRLVKPLLSIDSGIPQMRSCKSPGTTAPKQASSMGGSSPRAIHSGARSPGALARSAMEGKMMNNSAASVSMASSLPYLQHGMVGPTASTAYSPGMMAASVAGSGSFSGSQVTLVQPAVSHSQALSPTSRPQYEVSQPCLDLLERCEGTESLSAPPTHGATSISDNPPHVVFSINVSRASDAPVCATAETVMSSQVETATSTCSPQASSHPHPHPHPQPPPPLPSLRPSPVPSDPVPSLCNRQCEDGGHTAPRTAGAPLPTSLPPTSNACAMNHSFASTSCDLGHSTVSHNSSLEGLAGRGGQTEPGMTIPISASMAVAPASCQAGASAVESQPCPQDSSPQQAPPSVQHSTSGPCNNFGEVLKATTPLVVQPSTVSSTQPPPPPPPMSVPVNSQAQMDVEAMLMDSEFFPPLPPLPPTPSPPPTPPPPPPLPTDPYPQPPFEVDSSGEAAHHDVSVTEAPSSSSVSSSAAASVSRTGEGLQTSPASAGGCKDSSRSEAGGLPSGSGSSLSSGGGQRNGDLCTSKAAESECDKQTQNTVTGAPATSAPTSLAVGQPSNSLHSAPTSQSGPAASVQPPTSDSEKPAQQVTTAPTQPQDSVATTSVREEPMEVDEVLDASPAKTGKVEKSESHNAESRVQVDQAPVVSEDAVKSGKVGRPANHSSKVSPKGVAVRNKVTTVTNKAEVPPTAPMDAEVSSDLGQPGNQTKASPNDAASHNSSSTSQAQAASGKDAPSHRAEKPAPTPPSTVAAPPPPPPPPPVSVAGKVGHNGAAAAKVSVAPSPAQQATAVPASSKADTAPKPTSKADTAGTNSPKLASSQSPKDGVQPESKKAASGGSVQKTRESPGRGATVAELLKKEPVASVPGVPSSVASKPAESVAAPPVGNGEEPQVERTVTTRLTRKRRRTQSDSEPEHTPTPLPALATSGTTTAANTTSSITHGPSSSAPNTTVSSITSSTPALTAALLAPISADFKPETFPFYTPATSVSEVEKTATPGAESSAVGMRLRETRRHSGNAESKQKTSTEEASDSTAPEKTAGEKMVVEKTAGEKSSTEKNAVEKGTTDKNAVEKTAAEKNSTEKNALEKGAAEKKMDGASKEEELGRKTVTGRRQRGLPLPGHSYFDTPIMQGRTRSQSAPKGEKEKEKEKEKDGKEQNLPPPPPTPKEDAAAAATTTPAAAAATAPDSQKRPTRALRQKDPPEQPAAKRRRPRDPR